MMEQFEKDRQELQNALNAFMAKYKPSSVKVEILSNGGRDKAGNPQFENMKSLIIVTFG